MHTLRAGLAALALAAIVSTLAAAADDEAIRPSPKNPRYWEFRGKPVLLLGGSVEDNLFQIPDLVAHLDALAACGGNYVRCTMSSRDEGNVWPFARAGDAYDLAQWNPEFWRRFEVFLAETARRGIVVQIEVWATFDYYREPWSRNPFNPANNSTYTADESGLPTKVDSHPTRAENDFFRSVPGARHLKTVLAHQERFVEKMLSHTLRHGHVLYCMDNETSVTPAWGAYWAGFIRDKARAAGRRAEVTEMWDAWNLADPQHNATFDHPETYSFVDVSQNNQNKGQAHYDNLLAVRQRLAGRARPMNSVKVYGADTGRYGATRDGVERFWRNVFGGCASTRFHRPTSGLGLSPLARKMIRAARDVTDAFDVFACEPHPDLLADRADNEAYCLAEPGRQYAVYFPARGRVTLDLAKAPGRLALRWYDIGADAWRDPAAIEGGGALPLETPGDGPWAAVIQLPDAKPRPGR